MGLAVFETALDLDRHWVLSEHKMLAEAVVPGTTYLEMARAAAQEYRGSPVTEIRDVDFLVPMLVRQDQPRTVHVMVREREGAADAALEFTVSSRDPAPAGEGEWVRHARGVLRTDPADSLPAQLDPGALRERCDLETMDVGRGQAEHRVMQFGRRWQGSLQTVYSGDMEALGRLDLPAEYHDEDRGYVLHPALLDLATGFSGFAVLGADVTDRAKATPVTDFFLPLGYDRLRLHAPIPLRGYSHIRPQPGVDPMPELRKVDVTIMDDEGQVAVDISGFTVKRVNAPDQTIQRLRSSTRHYITAWTGLAPVAPAAPPTRLLVLGSPGADTGGLAAAARESGTNVIELPFADADPDEARLASQLSALGMPLPGQLVFAAAPASGRTHQDSAALEEFLACGLHSLFRVIRALASINALPESLTVVAPYANAVTGKEPAVWPANAALFGLAKVIAHENEGLAVRCIDTEPGTPAESLFAELCATGQPGLVALRDGQRYVQELTEGELPPEPPVTAADGATYLITGGLGGLGLAVARSLGQAQPGSRLALVSRRGLPPRAQWGEVLASGNSRHAQQIEAVRAIEAEGARVECFAADVTSHADMEGVVRDIRGRLGRVDCIVHAAGVAGDGFIFRKDPAVFSQTLGPKVLGTTVLDSVTRSDPPDLMVLFGSTTAVFGAAGQSDYTAGNSYLDAFADYRRAEGLRTVTIDWSDWLGTGMAFDHGVRRDQGFFRSISIDDGVASFGRILGSQAPRVIVGEINYELLGAIPPESLAEQLRRSPLVLSPLIMRAIRAAQARVRTEARALAPAPDVAGDPVQLTGREDGGYSPTEEKIAQIWARELGLSEVNVFSSSFDLGGDSLIALRTATGLQQVLGTRVTIVDLFRFVTIAELAEHLDAEKPTQN
jgi:NAD(P)-dependent dehydrogenase (short-subunit alcohol dehydrogenase family)/acyl carrier protein